MSAMWRRWLAGAAVVVACLVAWSFVARSLATTGPVLTTVAVGMYPSAIAIDSAAGRALVLNSYDTTVSVIDEATGTVVATTTVGSNGGAHPQAIALDSRLGHAFVSTDDGEVSMLDSRSGRLLRSVRVGSGLGAIAVSERTSRAFVADVDAGTIAVIDTAAGTLLRMVPVGPFPVAIVCDARSGRAFVADQGDGTIVVLDTRSGRLLRSVPVGDAPEDLALSDRFGELLVAGAHGSLVGLDTMTEVVRFTRAPLGQGSRASGLLVAADDPTGFALVGRGARILEIDPRTGASRGSIRLPSAITALAPDSRTGWLLATLRGPVDTRGYPFGDGSLVRIGTDARIAATVKVGIDPAAIALDSVRGRVFVVHTNLNPDGSVSHPRPPPEAPLTRFTAWLRGWIPGLPSATPPLSRSGSVTALRLGGL